MQPGEKATLQFLPEFEPVMKDFDGDGIAETLRYEYKSYRCKPSRRWPQAVGCK
jgi:hypothetical protein